MCYHLHMPLYILWTFTEYPLEIIAKTISIRIYGIHTSKEQKVFIPLCSLLFFSIIHVIRFLLLR